ncbi:alcohol dehydrogenase [Streptomyces humidus]|uniref:Alcohol dehydrogenase n=1 Tax=Streptomyces humidus TaxID=52259 RepID=A0A918L5K4_9ACTN|nr:zinc-binding alcohol dehydrogenase family protein [Streptomyces humidus]GGS09994.1 alcohol dehydrogenase [Streptomyces humidus]
MRAVVVTDPETAPVGADFPEPEPVLDRDPVSLVGAGVHQLVRALAAGQHYGGGRQYPLVPGIDAVARTPDGRLVYTALGSAPWGTMAERLATPFGLELPAGADPLAVAAGVNPGLSGWLPLSARHEEKGGLGTVLVLGATGMAGSMAVRAARSLGATRVLAAGVKGETLNGLGTDGVETVAIARSNREVTQEALITALAGEAPSLVLDYVWGPTAEAAFAALARHGFGEDSADIAYVQVGTLGGADASVPAALLRSRRMRITGSGAGSVPTQRLLTQIPRVIGAIAEGILQAPYTAYPISRAGEAWAHSGPTRAVIVPD